MNQGDRIAFNEAMNSNKINIGTYLVSIQKTNPPEDMQEFHKILVDKYNTFYESILYSIDVANSKSKESISKYKIATDKNALQAKQQQAEMLRVFDNLGIKYERVNNQIKYWYGNNTP